MKNIHIPSAPVTTAHATTTTAAATITTNSAHNNSSGHHHHHHHSRRSATTNTTTTTNTNNNDPIIQNAPVLPADMDLSEILSNESTLRPFHTSSSFKCYLLTAEPHVFLQGFVPEQWNGKSPGMLRGQLILKILKPTKLKSINIQFKGVSVTEWPEGIPPKNNDFNETNIIANHNWPFFKYEDYDPNATNFIKDNSGCTSYYPLNAFKSTNIGTNNTFKSISLLSLNSTDDIVSNNSNNNHGHNNNNSMNVNSGTAANTSNTKDHGHSTRSLSPIAGLLNMTRKRSNTGSSMESGANNNNNNNNNNNSNNNNSGTGNTTTTSSNHNSITNNTSNTSIFSDLLSVSLNNATTSTTTSNNNNNGIHLSSSISNNTIINDDAQLHSSHYIFQPGYYIYVFEQLIPLSYPETIKATFGSVEYFLEVLIERTGTFKSNIHYKHPIKIIRTQSDSSVEETEPISIVRDWEDQLHYDILIASKDIVLDAFLPISFNLTPLDKVSLHRVRIYLTETMEYYCKFKKVHRLEPTKKFLLCELKAPPLPKLPKDKNKNKAKNLGNLLEDNNKNGYITYKEFDFQVYVPEVLNSQNRVHPDTTYENIKANHWIKVCLRLSKLVDGKQKHFEISIDSPIHVLDKQCSHANTLLPSYTSHLSIPSFIHNTTTTTNNNNNNNNNNTVASGNNAVNSPSVTQYHGSNLYFPKEILYSPLLSPNVEPININGHHNNAMSLISLNDNRHTSNNNNNHHHHRKAVLGISSSRNASVEDFILHSPELRSNIYTPDNLKAELMSPQAVPLGSPTLSPTLSPVIPTSTTPPPPFSEEPSNPPTYADVLKKDGIIPRKGAITTSNSNTSTTENERDFAEGFNFHHSAFPALAPQMRKSNSVSYGNVGDNYNSNGHNLYNDISTVLLNSNDPVHLSPSVSPLKPMASPTSKPTLLKNDKEVDIENLLLKPNSPKKSTDNHNDNQLSDEGDLSAISSLSGSPINSTGLLRKSMDSGISTSSSMISNTNANVGSHNNHGNHLDVPGKRLSTDSDDGGMVPLLQRISRQNTNTTESPTTYTEGRLHNAGNLRFSPSPTRSTNNRNSVYNNTGMDSEMYNSNQLGNANAGRYVEGHGHAKVNNPFAASEESFLDKYSKVEDASIDLAALLSRSAETTPQHLLLRKHDQCKYANANNGSNVAARKNVPTNDTNNKLHCHNSNASSGSSNNVMFELNSEGGNSNNTDIINKENYSNYGNKNLELNDAASGLNASFNAKEKYGLKYVQENDILNDFSSMMK